MLAVCFNLIGLSSRLTNSVPVACMNAVGTSFAYCFQIAGGIYVIFLELVAWIVASLSFFFFNVTASENKLASLPYEYLPVSFCCLSAAFLSFGKLETHFTEEDWVFRENELQPSSQKQERSVLCTSESVLYISFRKSTSRKLSFAASAHHWTPCFSVFLPSCSESALWSELAKTKIVD